MPGFTEFITDLKLILPFVRILIIVALAYVVLGIILGFIKRNLLKRAKTKKQISNVEIFSTIFKYLILVMLIIFALFSYGGSLTGLGLSLGLLSAALGWALQKPITGVAAWIMIVIKRPFEIGDRVIIGDVKGDVTDISLTHIYIGEIGGIVSGEEKSGRIIMVPNSILFEQNIINYTYSKDDYVLDQVAVPITFESDLDKAIQIALKSAEKHLKGFSNEKKEKPYVRTYFQPHGMNVFVRYFSPAKKLQELSSLISKEIYDNIKHTKGVEIAYPHTEVLYRKKGR